MPAEFLYPNIELFKQKALHWASLHSIACYFDSNGYTDPYSAFDVLIAFGAKAELSVSSGNAFDELQEFIDRYKTWTLGFLTYDLKNELEDLHSKNPDQLHFPDLFFFIPEHLILIKGNTIQILSDSADEVFKTINRQEAETTDIGFNKKISSKTDRDSYLKTVKKLKEHIVRGDIYEVNLCQEFFSEDASIHPVATFTALNNVSPTPFANFFKYNNQYIISATPERFLSKRNNKLISQPIKGTAKRSESAKEDLEAKSNLKSNIKEQSENVMIVDLVRNDLTKSAIPGTVQVEELFGIYSFKQVHQMISTVVCEANPALKVTELIKNAFPMGSMTGAPKIRAMQLIDDFESTKRGVFSGAVGYFTPKGDFDFNVIIRTILYNAETRYLSFQTGSAITFDSDPEKEYEECLLKAKAIREVLSQ